MASQLKISDIVMVSKDYISVKKGTIFLISFLEGDGAKAAASGNTMRRDGTHIGDYVTVPVSYLVPFTRKERAVMYREIADKLTKRSEQLLAEAVILEKFPTDLEYWTHLVEEGTSSCRDAKERREVSMKIYQKIFGDAVEA